MKEGIGSAIMLLGFLYAVWNCVAAYTLLRLFDVYLYLPGEWLGGAIGGGAAVLIGYSVTSGSKSHE